MPGPWGVHALRTVLLLALLAAASAHAGVQEPRSQSATLRRRLAAAPDTTSCPRAALYIVPALPNVRDAATFQLVRSTYINTVKRLAPAGAISGVIPLSTEPNKQKGGILAHTVILFSGSCATGKAAARALHVELLGDVRPLFYVPAPRAKSLFGDVYMATVSHPYLANGNGTELSAPAAPAGTNLAAQFSITWVDVPPSMVGEQQAAAFKAAILSRLPSGAGVFFTTMISEGVSHRFGSHWRASAAPVSPAAAKSAGPTSQGGVVWPPGQPAGVRSGRLVFNSNIAGAVFNTAAGKAALAKFLADLRFNTAAVLPTRTFGRMALQPGSGLRLVNDVAYPCTCKIVSSPPPPTKASPPPQRKPSSPPPPRPKPSPPPPRPSPPPPKPSPPPPRPSPPPPKPSPPPPRPSPPPPKPSPPPPSPSPPPPSPSPPPPSPSPPPPPVSGQVQFTTPGTFLWTAPAGVTSVSVVCIGGGGGASPGVTVGSATLSAGGGGGGLGWQNNIAVFPGSSYTVQVGAGGDLGADGGDSYFMSVITVKGGGGGGGSTSLGAMGGSYFPTTQGGAGGESQPIDVAGSWSSAGGGAGGYGDPEANPPITNGYGGSGGGASAGSNPKTGGGGAGGGDADGRDVTLASSGGGTGLLGRGMDGSRGITGNPTTGGGGGSGGAQGSNSKCSPTATCGGAYGGGGGMGRGGDGACRIMWGPGRAYPATNTQDV